MSPRVKVLFRFATEMDDPGCLGLKSILLKSPEMNDSNVEIFLSVCREAVLALNDHCFIVIGNKGVTHQGESLGMSDTEKEIFSVEAQQYMLNYVKLHCKK